MISEIDQNIIRMLCSALCSLIAPLILRTKVWEHMVKDMMAVTARGVTNDLSAGALKYMLANGSNTKIIQFKNHIFNMELHSTHLDVKLLWNKAENLN